MSTQDNLHRNMLCKVENVDSFVGSQETAKVEVIFVGQLSIDIKRSYLFVFCGSCAQFCLFPTGFQMPRMLKEHRRLKKFERLFNP